MNWSFRDQIGNDGYHYHANGENIPPFLRADASSKTFCLQTQSQSDGRELFQGCKRSLPNGLPARPLFSQWEAGLTSGKRPFPNRNQCRLRLGSLNEAVGYSQCRQCGECRLILFLCRLPVKGWGRWAVMGREILVHKTDPDLRAEPPRKK